MIRFDAFESLGVRVAAMSDRADGHCGLRGEDGAVGRAHLTSACGVEPLEIVCGNQVHDKNIAIVREEDRGRGTQPGRDPFAFTDGLITNVPELPLAVFVADCVPVFLLDPVCKAIALVHAGREGTLLRIAAHAVRLLEHEYGTCPANVQALIGPSAGPCCYEVSDVMAKEFVDAGFLAEGRFLDLWHANLQQLCAVGVQEINIAVAGTCTICSERFFSYRRDASQDRNMAMLML